MLFRVNLDRFACLKMLIRVDTIYGSKSIRYRKLILFYVSEPIAVSFAMFWKFGSFGVAFGS